MRLSSLWKAAVPVLILTLAGAGSSRAAGAEDPILGTWKLNLSKSKYIPGPAPRSQTRVYKQTPDGIFVAIDTVDASGRQQKPIQFAEKYDGKDYPMTGSTV